MSIGHCDESVDALEPLKQPQKLDQTLEVYNLEKATTAEELNQFKSFHRKVVLDLDCLGGGKVLQRASDLWAVNESMHFFLLGSDYNATIEFVNTQDVQINSKINLIISRESTGEFDIYEVHSPGRYRTNKIYFNHIGACSSNKSHPNQRHCNITRPKLNYNMEGSYLDVAFVVSS